MEELKEIFLHATCVKLSRTRAEKGNGMLNMIEK